jgi:hypothetical protein
VTSEVVIRSARRWGIFAVDAIATASGTLTIRNGRFSYVLQREEIDRFELSGNLGTTEATMFAQVRLRDGATHPIEATSEVAARGVIEVPQIEAHIRALNEWLAG